ncbi:ribonuclease P protein component [Xanthocytophaga agilis]|uniref:Ribonuclease P protein component n=1 Tax=Xanthocytophaga agilis TaxID=3048010 RepID=A0AAE3R686_9BACT|nr:ribonuclease P protein component [Xanthocytophaga agilis]MDJ1502362.1 ribonuclease P protein component [Xanthocytophaga agilis]
MLVKNQNLPKAERLCSKKIIEELFQKGSSVYLYPFRIQYLPRTDEEITYPQIFFSISKRNFKRSNKRNLIRRRLKEIYRHHKYEWLSATPPSVFPAYLSVIYVSKEILPSDILSKKFNAVWKKLQDAGLQTTSHSSF